MDLNLLPLFLAVADAPNFRVAADRLGVTRSAVSQGVARLEAALGTTLVIRTTRSVCLTDAGRDLRAALQAPLAGLTDALERAAGGHAASGLLRLAVSSIAEHFLDGPLLAAFAAAHPQVCIDVTVTDDALDIVAAGFDAGIGLGEAIAQDMVAVALTGEQREVVAASPAYLAAHGAPSHPRELLSHRCIGWRPAPDNAPYRWEFAEHGVPFEVAVQPQITTNDLRLMLRTALADGGITFAPEDTLRVHLDSGELVPLLQQYLPPFPGFFLYFPRTRHPTPKLRALVEHVRQWR